MEDRATTHEAAPDARNRDVLIWVDGALVHRDQAKVSVYDSGFLLGDGIWEGLRLHGGRWAFLEAHLDRLAEAGLALDIAVPPKAELVGALDATRRANGMETDAHARLMVTRGRKRLPFQHPGLTETAPTLVIIMEHSVPHMPRPVRLATVPHIRGLPMSQDPKLNTHSKVNCVLACIAAGKAGADEALMLDVHGFVATTNACNFFVVRRGEVWTSTGDYCFNGITRGAVIALARDDGIPCHERNFSLVDCYGADEAFLTGSFGGLTPVGAIDGRTIGTGGSGPVTERLRGLYAALVGGDAPAA